MIFTDSYASPLGKILLAGDEGGLTGLWFAEGSRYAGPVSKSLPRECFESAKAWLDIYFTGRDPGFMPKMHWDGSDFRRRVWEILREIPFGQTVTYGWIAERITRERGLSRMSPQAIGGAVGHNPIAILVPCHRVMGANGNLTGYGGGIPRKIALLELEGVDTGRFTIPAKR